MRNNTVEVAMHIPLEPTRQTCSFQFEGCKIDLHGLTKSEAEEVLDWLEVHHCPHELAIEQRRRFAVSYLQSNEN